MPQTTSDHVVIDYDDLGSGEPALLLLSGWCSSRSAWAPVLDPLSRGRRVLALDWRGHGASGQPTGDFGERELARDAQAVIAASGARHVVPVALANAGWVAIELRRALGDRVAGLVLVDWMVGPAPAEFLATLEGMRAPDEWRSTVDAVMWRWSAGVREAGLQAFLASMSGAPAVMWDRAAREIAGAYAEHGSPLQALSKLRPPPATLHLHSWSADRLSRESQREFARRHPRFRARELPARSHFPAFEVPSIVTEEIEAFAEGLPAVRGLLRAA